MDWSKAATPAYVFLVMILTIGVVMLVYTLFYDYVVTIFYDMGMSAGGDASTFGFIREFWRLYIIIGFVVSLVIWAVVSVMRQDDYGGY